jgi:hypothetical protein
MAKKKWNAVMRDARWIYQNRERFAYLWGSNGECPRTYAEAKALVERCWAMNPAHFQESVINRGHTKDELARHITGKICYDCSSFVCAVTQSEGDIYHLKVVKDYNSSMLNAVMINVTTPALGTWSNVLWVEGHVAIDVASGMAIDFANEFIDCRQYIIVGENPVCRFTRSGQLPWVDYEGALNV